MNLIGKADIFITYKFTLPTVLSLLTIDKVDH